MTEPEVISRRALAGKRIGISASESADLARLGLSEHHCRLVIAEVGRAAMLAGATVVYGGRLGLDNYTSILVDEAERFGGSARRLELYIAESEYSTASAETIRATDQRLGEHGRLYLVSSDGVVREPLDELTNSDNVGVATSLTALRRTLADRCDARIIVGGKLAGYAGSEPGVIEEARLTISADKVLLVAGGYGGASAAVLQTLGNFPRFDAAPNENYPAGVDSPDVMAALESLSAAIAEHPAGYFGSQRLRNQLAYSHRPADLASAVVRLLDVHFNGVA